MCVVTGCSEQTTVVNPEKHGETRKRRKGATGRAYRLQVGGQVNRDAGKEAGKQNKPTQTDNRSKGKRQTCIQASKQTNRLTQAGNRADGDGQTIEQEADNRAGDRQ